MATTPTTTIMVALMMIMAAQQQVASAYYQQPAQPFKTSGWQDGSATFYGDDSGYGADFGM
jgi:hypothetical protein